MNRITTEQLRATLNSDAGRSDALSDYMERPVEERLERVAENAAEAYALRATLALDEWTDAIAEDVTRMQQRPSLLQRIFTFRAPLALPAAGAAAVAVVALTFSAMNTQTTESPASAPVIDTPMVASQTRPENVFATGFESDLLPDDFIMRNGMES